VYCKTCKGLFAQNTIRIHFSKCNKKGALSSGRCVSRYIHPCANNTLRQCVFPILRDDDISRCRVRK